MAQFISRFVSFAKATVNGDQVIAHGLGESPKAILFFTTGVASVSGSVDTKSRMSFGFATAPANQYSASGGSSNNDSPTQAARRIGAHTLIIKGAPTNGIVGIADLKSWDATNFTITWSSNGTPACIVHALVLGGSDLQVKCLNWQLPTSAQGASKSITGAGFSPDAVIHIFVGGVTSLDTNVANNGIGIGAMDKNGSQFSCSILDLNGVTTSDAQRSLVTDYSISMIDQSLSIVANAQFSSMDADGFTVTCPVRAGSAYQIASLCLRGINIRIGNFLKTTGSVPPDPGYVEQAIPVGFKTQSILFFSHCASSAGALSHARISAGGADDAGHEGSDLCTMQDGANPSNSKSVSKNDKAFMVADNTSANIEAECDFGSADFQNTYIRWTTNNGVATQIAYIALSKYVTVVDAPVGGSIPISGGVSRAKIVNQSAGGGSVPVGGGVSTKRVLTINAGQGTIPIAGALSRLVEKDIGLGSIPISGVLQQSPIYEWFWSTHDTDIRTPNKEKKILVEITSDPNSLPANSPSDRRYSKRLTPKFPDLSKIATQDIFGIISYGSIDIEVSNIGQDGEPTINPMSRDLTNLTARVWEGNGDWQLKFRGTVRKAKIGSISNFTIEDLNIRSFSQIYPRRIIDTTLFPKTVDQGSIQWIFGRCEGLLLKLVHVDNDNRQYRYLVGEGIGLNGGYFDKIYTLYRNDSAFYVATGTVRGATANTITFDSADRQSKDWYTWWWVVVTDSLGNKQTRYLTGYDSTTNTGVVDSNWIVIPQSDGTWTYELKQWRFYIDLSTKCALVELKQFQKTGSTNDVITADVDGFQEEKNFARAVQSFLSNDTWGMNRAINIEMFDEAAASPDIASLSCEGFVADRRRTGNAAQDILADLMRPGRMIFEETDAGLGIKINSTPGQSKITYSYQRYLVKDSYEGVDFTDLDQRIRNITVRYNFSHKKDDFIGSFTRASSDAGVDTELLLPFTYSSADADRLLDIERKLQRAKIRTIRIKVNPPAGIVHSINDKVTLDLPRHGINLSDFIVESASENAGVWSLSLFPDDPNIFIYEPSSTLPPAPAPGIIPDYTSTPPVPLSNVIITPGYIINADKSVTAYFDISATPPESNYKEFSVQLKQSADSIYQELGRGYDFLRLSNPIIIPGLSYDFIITPWNFNATLAGLAYTQTGIIAGGDNKTPKAVTGFVNNGGHGDIGWKWNAVTQNTDNSNLIAPLMDYELEIYPANSLSNKEDTIYIKPSDKPQYTYLAQTANLANSSISKWARIRARKWNGQYSAWTSPLVQSSTSAIVKGDVPTNEFTSEFYTHIDGPIAPVYPAAHISGTVTIIAGAPVDLTWIIMMHHSADSSVGNSGWYYDLLRGNTVIKSGFLAPALFKASGGIGEQYYSNKFTDSNPPAGTFTYSIKMTPPFTGLPAGVDLRDLSMTGRQHSR